MDTPSPASDWRKFFASHIKPARMDLKPPPDPITYLSFCRCCGAALLGKNRMDWPTAYFQKNKGIYCGAGITTNELKEVRKGQGLDYPDLKTFELEVDGLPYSFMWRDTDT